MLTNMVSRYLVATLMFIKSPRTTFSCERRAKVLTFQAPLAGFVLFIAYGVDQSFVRPARGPLFNLPKILRLFGQPSTNIAVTICCLLIKHCCHHLLSIDQKALFVLFLGITVKINI